jgi:hypothetical protein
MSWVRFTTGSTRKAYSWTETVFENVGIVVGNPMMTRSGDSGARQRKDGEDPDPEDVS